MITKYIRKVSTGTLGANTVVSNGTLGAGTASKLSASVVVSRSIEIAGFVDIKPFVCLSILLHHSDIGIFGFSGIPLFFLRSVKILPPVLFFISKISKHSSDR